MLDMPNNMVHTIYYMSELKSIVCVCVIAVEIYNRNNSNLTRLSSLNIKWIDILYKYEKNFKTKDFYEICMLGQKKYEFREAIYEKHGFHLNS